MTRFLGVRPAQWGRSLPPTAIFLLWGLLIFPLASCRNAGDGRLSGSQPGGSQRSLTVYAAASLAEAMGELAMEYKALNPGVEVALNLAGSQQLAQQIVQGAPADVFASADWRHMQSVVAAGRVRTADARILTHNRLVVAYPAGNPAGLLALSDLQRPGLRLVLAAPEVPAGRYAVQFLENAARDPALGAAFMDHVLQNTVSYEENVRAVLSKLLLGEADAGLVYASDVTGLGADKVSVLPIPDSLNPVAEYPIAPLADSPAYGLAESFVALALSPEGQRILANYGFANP